MGFFVVDLPVINKIIISLLDRAYNVPEQVLILSDDNVLYPQGYQVVKETAS